MDSFIQVFSDLFADVILYSSVKSSPEQRVGLGLLVVMGFLIVYFTRKAQSGAQRELRPLPGLVDIESHIQETVEKGQKVHVSVGVGGLADASALQTMAGVDVMRHIARRAVATGADLTATTNSAVTLPLISEAVRSGYDEVDKEENVGPENVRLIGMQPIPYAAGVSRLLSDENVGFNTMIGSFGDEYLLMGETGARRGIHQLVATANPVVLPFAVMTASNPLIGEEMFAAGAYLEPTAPRVGSIATQDVIRIALVFAILGGVVVATVLRALGH